MTVRELRILRAINVGFDGNQDFWCSLDAIQEKLREDGLHMLTRHQVVSDLVKLQGRGSVFRRAALVETKEEDGRTYYRMTGAGVQVLMA